LNFFSLIISAMGLYYIVASKELENVISLTNRDLDITSTIDDLINRFQSVEALISLYTVFDDSSISNDVYIKGFLNYLCSLISSRINKKTEKK